MFRRFDPIGEMREMFRDFDRAFDGLYPRALEEARSLPALVTGSRLLPGSFYPAVECFTRDKNLVMRAELPGIDPKDVEVSVTGDQLTIRGEKKLSRESKEGDVHLSEVAHGRFERTFTLPEGVKTDDVKATFANGVLEITMPAEDLPAPRRVPVEAAGEGRVAIKAA